VLTVRSSVNTFSTLEGDSYRTWHGLGDESPVTNLGGPGLIPGESRRHLWCIEWYWDKFFSGYFGFSLSFHHCSILIHHKLYYLSNWQQH